MKKNKRIPLLVSVSLISAFALIGCGDDPSASISPSISESTSESPSTSVSPSDSVGPNEVASISVKSGLKKSYYLEEEVDLNLIKLTAVYGNGTSVEVSGSECSFNPSVLKTDTSGENSIKITYKEANVDWVYNVIDHEQVVITNLELPSNIITWNKNNKVQTEKPTEFFNLEEPYKVGDDNPFKFLPIVNAYDYINDKSYVLDDFDSLSTISIKENGTFTVLSGMGLTDKVLVDEKNHLYDFTPSAVGNTFEIKVQPINDGIPDDDKEVIVTFQFTVVDGYNAYNSFDLTYLDNNGGTPWNTFRKNNKMDETKAIPAIIMQNDIVIKHSDIPTEFYYQESDLELGDSDYDFALYSLKDNVDIFTRIVEKDETFTFEGNYFSLSLAKEMIVYRPAGDIVIDGKDINGNPTSSTGFKMGHTTLLRVNPGNDPYTDGSDNVPDGDGTFIQQNMRTFGNCGKSENLWLAGGVIQQKINNIERFEMNNVINNDWFISFFTETSCEGYYATDCKAYNNFNSFVYNWGCSNMNFTNCEMNGAGGPVLIADTVNPENEKGGSARAIPNNTFTDCNLHSLVAGSEGWFTLTGSVALVGSIKALGVNLLPQYGESFIKYNNEQVALFDLLFVNKSGNSEDFTNFVQIGNKTTIIDTIGSETGTYPIVDCSSQTNRFIFETLYSAGAGNAPVFADKTGTKMAYFDGTRLVSCFTNQPIAEPNYLGSEYMTTYLGSTSSSGRLAASFAMSPYKAPGNAA